MSNAAIVVDVIGAFSITEMTYGPTRRYGVREALGDKWCPIGGTCRSLEGAYLRIEALLKGDPEWTKIRKDAHWDHHQRFALAA